MHSTVAVPVAAVVKVFVGEALLAYRHSGVFGDEPALAVSAEDAQAPPPS